ncbi:MAG: hypothetical protein MHM6MM_005289 [Cercozoa sp. M6MM]
MSTVIKAEGDVLLQEPPSDGITRVRFSPTSESLLAVTSWDASVSLHRVHQDAAVCVKKSTAARGALLDVQFDAAGNSLLAAGLDRDVCVMDIESGLRTRLGAHDQPVRCVEFAKNRQVFVTGSWDGTVRLWDARNAQASDGATTCQVGKSEVGARVYSMSCGVRSGEDLLLVAAADRSVSMFDVRRLDTPLQKRESPLKNQLRCVALSPDGERFLLSSVEGRVAVEYVSEAPELRKRKFAFKCHRRTREQEQLVYPVHSVAWHPTAGTFATGGGDGVVCVWDPEHKKLVHQFAPQPTSVSSLAFGIPGASGPTDVLLATAVSYAWEQGQKDAPADQVLLHRVTDKEVVPKKRRAAAAAAAAAAATS